MLFAKLFAIIIGYTLKGGMVMAYSAFEVARYIIHHEAQQNRPVSNLRLQKLLYFVQAKFVMDSHGTSPCFYERWRLGVLALLFEKYTMNIAIMVAQ